MSTLNERNSAVCVVGIGAATAVGASAPASAAAVRAGVALFVDHPYMINRDGDPFVVAIAPYLEEGSPFEERCVQLALLAGSEALEPVTKLSIEPREIPVVIGLPSQRPGVHPELGPHLASRLASSLRTAGVGLLPNGHSAGLMAIQNGCRLIQSGNVEFCLAGGVDSYLNADTLEWIEQNDQLHKSTNAWGFVPGEAAAFCLLSSGETARRHNLTPLGWIVGVETSFEENRIKTETVCIGKGLTDAVRKVLDVMPAAASKVDNIICDQNGEAYRAAEQGFMLARTMQRFVDASDFLSPADCWGDVGAASGPLFVMLASAAAQKKYAKGPSTLVWTSSEGGERAALIHWAHGEKNEAA